VIATSSPRFRRIAIIAGVWVVATGGVLLLATHLDSPVGAGARDQAQPAAPAPVADPATTDPGALPPLALVLASPPAGDLEGLTAQQQAIRLRDKVLSEGGAAKEWVALGSLLQQLGRGPMAEASYRQALAIEPGDLEARIGLIMVDGATGKAGAARAASALEDLARENPGSQVVAFNEGWLAAYRARADDARAAWRRTVALGAGTRLGRGAAGLLATLGSVRSGRNP
jgi:cytochrome c-type biogenesis protein CcmH/NrfG